MIPTTAANTSSARNATLSCKIRTAASLRRWHVGQVASLRVSARFSLASFSAEDIARSLAPESSRKNGLLPWPRPDALTRAWVLYVHFVHVKSRTSLSVTVAE